MYVKYLASILPSSSRSNSSKLLESPTPSRTAYDSETQIELIRLFKFMHFGFVYWRSNNECCTTNIKNTHLDCWRKACSTVWNTYYVFVIIGVSRAGTTGPLAMGVQTSRSAQSVPRQTQAARTSTTACARDYTFSETNGRAPFKRLAQSHEDPVKKPNSVVDVGYGIGGSSRYLSRNFGAAGYGVTMSPTQVKKAKVLAAAQELANKDIVKCFTFANTTLSELWDTWNEYYDIGTEGVKVVVGYKVYTVESDLDLLQFV
ncbi:Methyltransferase type 11 [Artemisia annua]|uniref:Methyltransferase type 11 n=1 Tax=Artemisia annua TaxID=35608 RepID=A0A2U1LGF6_ARTAN|nr:Methyltransferase type 11 [Artemisia annua]